MNFVVACAFGCGVLLVWSAWWEPVERADKTSQEFSLRRLLPGSVEPWQAVAGLVAGVAAAVVSGWPSLGVAVGVMVLVLPPLISGGSAEADFAEQTTAIASWVESLRDMMRSTHGIEGALRVTAENAPSALARDLRVMTWRIEVGQTTQMALAGLADDVNHPTCDLVVAVLINALGRSGAHVPEVLDEIADHARDRAHQHLQIHSSRQKYRTQLRLVGVIVAVSMAGFVLLFRGYLAPLGSGSGQVVLMAAALFVGGLLLWIAALSAVPHRERVLLPSALVGERL